MRHLRHGARFIELLEFREIEGDCRAAGGRDRMLLAEPIIACWISTFWIGMEFTDLLDSKEAQAEHRAALDAIQKLLEQLDARVGRGAARRRKK